MTDGREDVSPRVRFAEKNAVSGVLYLCSYLGAVLGGDEDNGGGILHGAESFTQIQSGHSFELDVEHQTGEFRAIHVREKIFGRGIRDRLKVSRPQPTAHGETNTLVIINDRDIDVSSAVHPNKNSMAGSGLSTAL